jgi:hypothetical protein
MRILCTALLLTVLSLILLFVAGIAVNMMNLLGVAGGIMLVLSLTE